MMICGMVGGLPSAVAADDRPPGFNEWQERRLLAPTPGEREREREGQVFIYDGMENSRVQRALDLNFDRIENMMFTRVHHPAPSGAGPVYVEEDGCD
jgi:hypothetical protein